jgi:hypothetical protein
VLACGAVAVVQVSSIFLAYFQGDRDAESFNPISPTILKWLRFRVVSWRHDFQPWAAVVWDCLIVGSLLCSMVTMSTKLYSTVNSVKLSYIKLNEVEVNSLKLSSIKLG